MSETKQQIFSRAGVAGALLRKLAEPGALGTFHTVMSLKRERLLSIGLVLEQRAAAAPDAPALRYRDETWTWDQFNRWVNRTVRLLEGEGLQRGGVIAVNLGNRPETLVLACAAAKLGAIAAMINTTQTGEVLRHSLDLVQAKLIFVGAEQRAAYASLDAATRAGHEGRCFHVADWQLPGDVPGMRDFATSIEALPEGNPATTATVQLKEPCFYIFTSGTSGLPKASVMSHYRWYRSAMSIGRLAMGLREDDVFYCCLPLYHNNALTLAMGSAMVSGACLAIGAKFSASRFWEEVRRYDATAFCYIGEILRYLLNQPPRADDRNHRVRAILGNGLRPDIWDAFKQRFGIARVHEFYAASEGTNGFINFFNYDRTCGFSPSGWELVPYDIEADEPQRGANGRMRKLGAGETGLLLTEVSEKMPFDGYTRKEDGEKKLLRDVFRAGDCWFNTGDLMRAQGGGHVQFVDRVGDTFRWQGENVATTQVEAIAAAWPQIEDAVVYGVKVTGRDGRCGMLSATLRAGEALDAAAFAAHLRASLPAYAVPRFLRLSATQDLTGTFKHQKSRLRQEGYDPVKVGDALWWLGPAGECWQALDAPQHARIESGEERL